MDGKISTKAVSFICVIFMSIRHTSTCPSILCSCDVDDTVDCTNRRLDQVPSWTDEEQDHERNKIYRDVLLSHNEIFSLQPSAFSRLKVTHIDLSNNQLIGISPKAFKDVTNYLEELNLSNTGLKVLHWASFNNLHRLRVLNLSRNELFAIPLGLFETLSSLHSLDLSHNLIGFLQAGTLKGLDSLVQMNIMDNKLSHIDDKCFVDVRYLTSLNLNSNFLTKINESTFLGLENLERLEIENNKIHQIQDGSFLVLPSLQYLSMSNNYITNITRKTLQGLSHLSELILEDNKIDNISDSSFISIQHLKQLHLENNQLVTLGSGGRPPLGLEGLDVLSLEDNPVNCSCELSWIQNIPAYSDHVTGSCSHPDGYIGFKISQIGFSDCKLKEVKLDASTKEEKENQIDGGGRAVNDIRLAS